jgi:hypothetical protein
VPLAELVPELIKIHNGQLRVERLRDEVKELSVHGIAKPTEAVGLTDEQIVDLKIKDLWTPKCFPSGGAVFNKDVIGRRTGDAPKPELAAVLTKTCDEAIAATSKAQAEARKCMTMAIIDEQIQTIKGAVMIVYPMGLPPYDETEHILNDTEDLSGRQAALQVIGDDDGSLWWAGKELTQNKKLSDFIGKNEKTTIIAKIQKKGGGAPVREPVVDEATQKRMMAHAYKKQEEMKKLEESNDDGYMNAPWAENGSLKSKMHGMSNVGFGGLR